MMLRRFIPLIYLILGIVYGLAQPIAAPKQEFRGAWISTVINLDWPTRGASPAQQQAELLRIFDDLKKAGINAVFFQLRSESDAFYASTLEPWSYYLTGKQGQSPLPFWDPLQFAIQEAHKRGMELHAWFNPFRVIRSTNATYPKDSLHVSIRHPEWMIPIRNILLLDPGIPAARQYIIDVATDIIKRYEVDGLHYDDYFYPYEGISNQDTASFAKYSNGLSLNAWREDNINRFVQELGAATMALKPWVKYGISPFGIWRNGVPPGITGLSGADVTYGNAVVWLEKQWIDYLAPQLYWRFGGNQDFEKLANWWLTQMNGRHLYPGIAIYRADPSTAGSAALYSPAEIPNQIYFTRQKKIPGVIMFRAANLSRLSTQGLADSLCNRIYSQPAFTPTMPWKSMDVPGVAKNLHLTPATNSNNLNWSAPEANARQAKPRFYAIYRVQGNKEPFWTDAIQDPKNLLAVTGATQYQDRNLIDGQKYWYALTVLSSNSMESLPTSFTPLSTRTELAQQDFGIREVFPNPFNQQLHVRYSIGTPGTLSLRVFNPLGQEMITLVDQERKMAGDYEAIWAPVTGAKPGLYICVLELDRKKMVYKVVKAP
jgi:uncharacterized lipoprotein YddW (UPF0748 family)